ncbi:MAG: addiction module protein [Pseudomonadota bacterium]
MRLGSYLRHHCGKLRIAQSKLEVLEYEVLKLTPADRTHLLDRLVASLVSDPEVEPAWERELDRREALLESSAVCDAPGPEALTRLRSRLVR